MIAEAGPSPDSISKITAGAWFDPARGQQRDDAIAVLAAHRVVLLGETHSDAEHHRWQLRTIEQLFDIRPDIALGFEMFPRHVQPVLERWRNDDISETAFLAEVDWPRIWGFDADLYWPLFRFARRHRLPMLALNVDRETTRRIAREGIANTSPEQREHVAAPAPVSERYRERLLGWFSHHPAGGAPATADPSRFDRFVEAQSFWDRAMAEAIAAACRARADALVIGLMGSGHIEYGDGVPHQLAALGISDVSTAVPWPAATAYPQATPPIADWLYGMAGS
uniref:PDZ/DHR/GLGF n=1 Tax=Rhodopseudomonas palustris (strain BisA53) TaxID=316055 RepID=Q07QK7_RHOP5